MAKRGWDRNELARRAKLANTVNLRFIERGMTTPRVDTLAKLASALEVSIEAFFVIKDLDESGT